MKFAPFLIFILFALRTTGRCSQLVIYNSALTDTSKKILYKYRVNEITFQGFDQDKYTAISSLGHTLEGFENYFMYRINNGKSILISIYENDKLIGQQRFEVRTLPPIQVRFGNLSDSLVRIEHLLVNPGLFLFYPEEYMIPHQIILRVEGVSNTAKVVFITYLLIITTEKTRSARSEIYPTNAKGRSTGDRIRSCSNRLYREETQT